MRNYFRIAWTKFCYFTLRLVLGNPGDCEDIDIYASRMLTDFNWMHRLIFPRFFSKTRIDKDSLNEAKKKIEGGIPIYTTTYIGQLEYNYFNYLFLNESLPLAEYVNGLSNWQWMPFKLIKRTLMTRLGVKMESGGTLPHPVTSGYVEGLITQGKSIFIRLKTSRIHDDLFWDIPEEDVVQTLIATQKKMDRTLYLIPQQFLWAKRPGKSRRSIIDAIFGERENPGWLRKNILFWRNYKSHAIAQFGEPLNLRDFIEAHPSIPDVEMTRILKSTLLSQIREERKRITGPALKPRRWIIENIVESELVQKQIYEVASEKGKDVEDVKILALRYAKEIASDINYSYIQPANRVLNWAFNTMYEGINYNHEGLLQIKKIAPRHPIIFVPNHRSHVDYLLLGNLLYGNDISVPHVAAGINLSFWPLGNIFRHCGAYFIRRTFGGNPLYKAVFESYLRLLIRERYCLEFFIEGGRSRTGKLRQPKLGMLSMLTQAMLEKSADELYFIPTSITYDKVAEESSYIRESSGKDKQKEKFSDILKLRKYLKHRYGKIYVNFGDPISFSKVISSIQTPTNPEDMKNLTVDNLANLIMNSINKNAVATPQALTSAAILMEERRGITSNQLFSNVDLLRSYFEFMGNQLSDTLVSLQNKSIMDIIQKLASQKIIEPHHDFDPVYYAIPEEMRATLDYQKNAIIHFLLPVAYVSSALLSLLKKGSATIKISELNDKINFLRGLFAFEFAGSEDITNSEMILKTLEFLNRTDTIKLNPNTKEITVTTLGTDALKQYKSIIENFLDSYRVAHYTCSGIAPDETIDENGLIKTMLKYGRHLFLLGKISRPEAITRPVFESALTFFKRYNFLTEELAEEKGRKRYHWNHSNPAIEKLQQELQLFS